jgi:hypothetical protein
MVTGNQAMADGIVETSGEVEFAKATPLRTT